MFLNSRNIISKIKGSKVTDYAAFRVNPAARLLGMTLSLPYHVVEQRRLAKLSLLAHSGQDFLLVDLREFILDLMGEGTKKTREKSSENDQLAGHFQSFFFRFFFFFVF